METNPYQTPESHQNPQVPYQLMQPQLTGIGGWLILPMLGLIVTVIGHAIGLFTVYLPIYNSEQWGLLTEPSSEYYHPLWGPVLIFETFGIAFIGIFAAFLLVLFFKCKKSLPKLIIIYYIISILFELVDLILASQFPSTAGIDMSPKSFIRSLIVGLIWISYFCVSRRVKNTFVK